MAKNANSFQSAADALADVRSLVLKGDELKRRLESIVEEARGELKNVEKSVALQSKKFSDEARSALEGFRTSESAISDGAKKSADVLDAVSTKIRQAASAAVEEITRQAGLAVSQLAADAGKNQGFVERAALAIEASTTAASERIAAEVGRLLERIAASATGVAEVERTLRDVRATAVDSAVRIGAVGGYVEREATNLVSSLGEFRAAVDQLMAKYLESVQRIDAAQASITTSSEFTKTAIEEIVNARNETAALRVHFRRDIRMFVVAGLVLFAISFGALAWAFISVRSTAK